MNFEHILINLIRKYECKRNQCESEPKKKTKTNSFINPVATICIKIHHFNAING